MYIQAVLYDYQFQETATDTAFRTKLEEMAQAEGTLTIHDMLNKVDSEAAAAIHHHNVRRVIRALEVFHVTGRKMSDIQREQKQESLYDSALIGLTMERNVLYERINKRVEQMLEIGLLEEVQHFYEKGIRDCQSLQAIGYKEIYKYYDGLLSLEDSIEELKQNSRRYAKRQLTWFRNKMNVQWFDMTESVKTHDITKNLQEISSYLEGMLKIKSNT